MRETTCRRRQNIAPFRRGIRVVIPLPLRFMFPGGLASSQAAGLAISDAQPRTSREGNAKRFTFFCMNGLGVGLTDGGVSQSFCARDLLPRDIQSIGGANVKCFYGVPRLTGGLGDFGCRRKHSTFKKGFSGPAIQIGIMPLWAHREVSRPVSLRGFRREM